MHLYGMFHWSEKGLSVLTCVYIQLNLCKTATLKNENWFQYQLSLNADQKYYRMLQRENFVILSTFIKLPIVIRVQVICFDYF